MSVHNVNIQDHLQIFLWIALANLKLSVLKMLTSFNSLNAAYWHSNVFVNFTRYSLEFHHINWKCKGKRVFEYIVKFQDAFKSKFNFKITLTPLWYCPPPALPSSSPLLSTFCISHHHIQMFLLIIAHTLIQILNFCSENKIVDI